jgi:hypothetical protein
MGRIPRFGIMRSPMSPSGSTTAAITSATERRAIGVAEIGQQALHYQFRKAVRNDWAFADDPPEPEFFAGRMTQNADEFPQIDNEQFVSPASGNISKDVENDVVKIERRCDNLSVEIISNRGSSDQSLMHLSRGQFSTV